MNREQRRIFQKNIHRHVADRFNMASHEIENPLHEGDKVRLDIDRITKRKNYDETSEEYRAFVESNRERIFTAHLYRNRENEFSAIIELVEEPKWLFWHGDLVRVENGG